MGKARLGRVLILSAIMAVPVLAVLGNLFPALLAFAPLTFLLSIGLIIAGGIIYAIAKGRSPWLGLLLALVSLIGLVSAGGVLYAMAKGYVTWLGLLLALLCLPGLVVLLRLRDRKSGRHQGTSRPD
jgi:peptidoglycan/LPS O-acetylase OafA/YrhL